MESYTYREIMSQGEAWKATLDSARRQYSQITDFAERTRPMSKPGPLALFTGCGSTYYLSLSAAYLWSRLVGMPSRALPASEIWLLPEYTIPSQPTLLITISRSGETTETVKALNVYRQHGGQDCLAVTCYADSTLARQAKRILVTEGAQEQSIAQTRSFSSMFLLIQAAACRVGGRVDLLDQMGSLPKAFDRLVSAYLPLAKGLAESPQVERIIYLGSGANYGLACEAMLKMKEMSLTPAEAFHFLEFRHGPKSMVAGGTLIVGLVSEGCREQEALVLREMRDLGATVLAIAESGKGLLADYLVEMHTGLDELVSHILTLPVLQLMAYYRALSRGLDPDRPTNLDAVVKLA
jgi:glucosamine--fructose-6-phosphate aminotransferase (isomerizing)